MLYIKVTCVEIGLYTAHIHTFAINFYYTQYILAKNYIFQRPLIAMNPWQPFAKAVPEMAETLQPLIPEPQPLKPMEKIAVKK